MLYSSVFALVLAVSGIEDGTESSTLPIETPQIEKYLAESLGVPDPLKEYHITYDASSGFDHAIPMIASITYRASQAEEITRSIAEKGEAAVIEEIKAGITNGKRIDVMTLDVDRADGSVVANMTGIVEMNWFFRPETNRLSTDFINEVVASDIEPMIDPSWEDYELITLPNPSHRKMTQVVILPLGGKGFSIQGRDLNLITANTEITRTLSLINGRAIAVTASRRLNPDILAFIFREDVPTLKWLANDLAFIVAPTGYKMSTEELEILNKQDLITPHALHNRGYQYFHQGEFEKALADFRKAGELAPEWSEAWGYQALSLLALEKTEEAEAALAHVDPATGKDDWVVQLAAGTLELAKADGDANRAKDLVTQSIALYPESDLAYYSRSFAYARLEQFDRMRADLEKTLEIDADHYGALLSLAWLDAWQEKTEPALAMADKIIAVFPNAPDGYVTKAELLRRFGRKEEARSLYDRGFELAVRGDTAGWDSLDDMKWSALIGADQTGRALRLANAALRKTPDDAKLLDMRCWVRGIAGKSLKKAMKDCQRAVALAPTDKTMMEGPGFILYRQGRFADAIAAFDSVTARSPLSPDAYFLRGLAKLNLGETGSGESDIKAAKILRYDIEQGYADYGIARP